LTTGLNNELIPLRLELANDVANLEQAKFRFEILRMQLDLYRTESANSRYSTL
jgi:hypothetical protein